jgi:hypothetical protein
MTIHDDERLMFEREGHKYARYLINAQDGMRKRIGPLLDDEDSLIAFFVGYLREFVRWGHEPPAMPDPEGYMESMLAGLLDQLPAKNREIADRIRAGVLR